MVSWCSEEMEEGREEDGKLVDESDGKVRDKRVDEESINK